MVSAPAVLGAALLVAVPQGLDARWEGDFFAASVIGEWKGRGSVGDEQVVVSRSWRFDLSGRLLRADLRTGTDGTIPRGLAFLQATGEHQYRLRWIDERQRARDLIGIGNPRAMTVSALYLESGGWRGPEWRRLTLTIEGPDRYRERLDVRRDEGWEVLSELVLTRGGRG